MFAEHQRDGLLFLTLEPLDRFDFLRHAFSTRHGDVASYLAAAGPAEWPLQRLQQAHSAEVWRIADLQAEKPCGDGMLTDRSGIWLGVQTADCVPVMLVDADHRAVGIFHAGWKGTAAGILQQGVARMRREFGTDAGRLHCGIGPAIGVCCYQVGGEVFESFHSWSNRGEYFNPDVPGKYRLDLWKANRAQVLEAGVPSAQIYGEPLCTACRVDRFFSHRGEHGRAGRMLAVIGMKQGSGFRGQGSGNCGL
ncbi:MAG: peptidoglycan editing factor PgeF [Acidobacteriota bacterium]